MINVLQRLVLISVLCQPCFLWAQWKAEGFDRASGLVSDRVVTHAIDSDGNLWLGTEKGLSVYDGTEWINVDRIEDIGLGTSKSLGTVKLIWEDEGGNKWVAAEKNLFIYSGKYWIDYKDRILEDFTATRFLQDSRGDIWICSEYVNRMNKTETYLTFSIVEGTLTRFDGKLWSSFNIQVGGAQGVEKGDPERYYSALLEDTRGRIWVGCVKGAHLYDGISWHTYDASTLAGDYVHFIYEDRRQDIWIGTKSGISRFHDGEWDSFSRKDGMDGNNATGIYEDHRGNLWVSIRGNLQMQGLAMFNGTSWKYFDSKDGLPPGNLSYISSDSTGRLWAMSQKGISYYREGKWELLRKHNGPGGKKYSAFLVARDGRLWVGTDEGIFSLEGGKWMHHYRIPGDLKGWEATVITEDADQKIWVGTNKYGVVVIREDSALTITTSSGLIGDDVKELFADPRGNVWVVGRSGVSRIFPGS